MQRVDWLILRSATMDQIQRGGRAEKQSSSAGDAISGIFAFVYPFAWRMRENRAFLGLLWLTGATGAAQTGRSA